MGEAKRKQKEKEQLEAEMTAANEKFNSIKEFPTFTPSGGQTNLHAIKAYHHLMRLIFIRAKHIHNALIKEFKAENIYLIFILLKAYWETVAILGNIYLTAERLIKEKNFSELLDWVTKQALGGKKFPTNEMLEEMELDREEFQQTNLLTCMEKIDKYFNKMYKDKNEHSKFRETYDEFIAEAGHPTFLGLSICEKRNDDKSITPLLDKIFNTNNNMSSLLYLSIANIIFFNFWDKFDKNINKQLEEASTS